MQTLLDGHTAALFLPIFLATTPDHDKSHWQINSPPFSTCFFSIILIDDEKPNGKQILPF
jgi:hypothetical protein